MLAAADRQDHPSILKLQRSSLTQAHGGGNVLENRLTGAERLAVGLRSPACILEIGHVLEQAADGDRLPALAVETVAMSHCRHHELGGAVARNDFEVATAGGR